MAVGSGGRVARGGGAAGGRGARMARSPRVGAADASQRWRKAGGNARPSGGMAKLPEIYRQGDMSTDACPPHREFRSSSQRPREADGSTRVPLRGMSPPSHRRKLIKWSTIPQVAMAVIWI